MKFPPWSTVSSNSCSHSSRASNRYCRSRKREREREREWKRGNGVRDYPSGSKDRKERFFPRLCPPGLRCNACKMRKQDGDRMAASFLPSFLPTLTTFQRRVVMGLCRVPDGVRAINEKGGEGGILVLQPLSAIAAQ